MPSPQDVLDFLAENPDVHGRRELGRAFGIKGKDRFPFKALLRRMTEDGLIGGDGRDGPPQIAAGNRRFWLPPVGLADIVELDDDGELFAKAKPKNADEAEDADPNSPLMRVCGLKGGSAPERLAVGDRILARFVDLNEGKAPEDDGEGSEGGENGEANYEARVIKRIDVGPQTRLGIVSGRDGGRLSVSPVSKKGRDDLVLDKADLAGAKTGDLVTFTIERHRRGQKRARVVQAHGPATEPGSVSLIAIHEEGIPVIFPASVLEAADAATLPGLEGRTDLRDLPLLTIDPADARDHDDAVHAEADTDPANEGGWIVTVAIADVAAFVTPGSGLDREARLRGNSVYFPDRVVPMLPEALSAGLCSLREGKDRPVLAVRMVFDAEGQKVRHTFQRSLMRSVASLSYKMVQEAWDGSPDPKTAPLLENVLTPLFAAYQAMAKARDAREPLDLNIPERRIRVDDKGVPIGIETAERYEAHRLIEECMIQANVAAAETLDKHKIIALRRVHDAPAVEKIDSLAEYLKSLDLRLAKGQVMLPRHFNHLLRDAAAGPNAAAVHDAVLRAQSQAVYAPKDLGHFGLNLRRYAHFTSPIRRYADVIIHRALITALAMGPDGLDADTQSALEQIGNEISDTERRAMRAERSTADRLIAHFLSTRIGDEFEGRVTGMARSGLFIGLEQTGADGFVPAATLGDDYFAADEALRAMVGERSGAGYRVGDTVTVRLVEADPLRGQIGLEMLTPPRELRNPGKAGSSRARRMRGAAASRNGPKRPRGRGKKTRRAS